MARMIAALAARRRRYGRGWALFRYRPGDGGYTFSRSSDATYTDANGVIQTASTDVLRDAHYVDGERTTLLEGQRTNLYTQSDDPVLNASVDVLNSYTANAGTAPDGTATAAQIGGLNSGDYYYHDFLSGLTGSDYTASLFVKKAASAGQEFSLEAQWQDGTTGAGGYHRFDLNTGATASSTIPAFTLEDRGDFWRIAVHATRGDATQLRVVVRPNYNGDGVVEKTALVWGAQLEEGPNASSYIPTSGSTVTRAADDLSFAYTEPPQEMTVYLKFVELSGVTNGEWLVNVGGLSAEMFLIRKESKYQGFHRGSADSNPLLTSPIPDPGAVVELRMVIASDGSVTIGMSVDGGAEETSSNATAVPFTGSWAAATLALGKQQGSSANYSFAAFHDAKIASGSKTIAQMRAL